MLCVRARRCGLRGRRGCTLHRGPRAPEPNRHKITGDQSVSRSFQKENATVVRCDAAAKLGRKSDEKAKDGSKDLSNLQRPSGRQPGRARARRRDRE